MKRQEDILKLFPEYMFSRFEWLNTFADTIQEIRFAIGKPLRVIIGGKEMFLKETGILSDTLRQSWCPTEKEIEDVIRNICRYSLYAFENEIRQGFLTVQGGHRIGLAGQVITDGQGQVKNISHIRFLNIRIAHEIIGAADPVIPFLYQNGELQNCLIVSPPGCGKTTLLRDIIRQVSNGNLYGQGMQIGIVDERSEIAGCYLGIPQNDVGIRTDVMDACPKVLGMMLLVRSMSPRAVAVDEIGCREDLGAITEVANCGGKVLATMHGSTIREIQEHFETSGKHHEEMKVIFHRYLFLKKENGIPVVDKILDEFFKELEIKG